MDIILGSASRWRAQILREAGIVFTAMSSGIDEEAIQHSSPQVLTMKLARAKSEALRPRITGSAVLLTADQVVVCGGIIREKPRTAVQARMFLRSYRKLPAECVTAVMAYNTAAGHDAIIVDRARVWFRGLTDNVIERLIGDGVIFSCAGGFAAGHPTFNQHVARIEGTLDSVMGLPLALTRRLIETVSET